MQCTTLGDPSLDYHEWVHKYGCYGWSYDDVLPVFEMLEKRKKNHIFGANFQDAKLGVGVSRFITYPPIENILLQYLRESKFHTGNYNFGNQDKIGSPEYAIWQGARSSSWNGYLKKILARKNLKILTFSKVTKINFDSRKRAVSVSYQQYGVSLNAMVTKEVILSAGSIASAQLLQLSGIGDFNHLSAIKVQPLIHHSPSVGENLQDHLIIPFIALSYPDIDVNGPSMFDILQYLSNKTGPLVAPLGVITRIPYGRRYSQYIRTYKNIPI